MQALCGATLKPGLNLRCACLYRSIATIPISIVHWHMGEEGWTFEPGAGVVTDPIHRATRLHQVYTAADPRYTGRVSVPLLWDRQRATIVNNESAEIIRMLGNAFD